VAKINISSIGRVLTVEAYRSPLDIAGLPLEERRFNRYIRSDNGKVIYFGADGVSRPFYTHLPLLVHSEGSDDHQLYHVTKSGKIYDVVFLPSTNAPLAETNPSRFVWSAGQLGEQARFANVPERGALPYITRRVSEFAAAGSIAYANRVVIDDEGDIRAYDDAGTGFRAYTRRPRILSEFVRGVRRVYFYIPLTAGGSSVREFAYVPEYSEEDSLGFLAPGTRSVTVNTRLSGAVGGNGETLKYINASDGPLELTSTDTIRNTLRQSTDSEKVIIQSGAAVDFWRYPVATDTGWEFEEIPGRVSFEENTPAHLLPGYVPPETQMNASDRMNTSDRMNVGAA